MASADICHRNISNVSWMTLHRWSSRIDSNNTLNYILDKCVSNHAPASDSSTVDTETRLQTASIAIKSIVQGIKFIFTYYGTLLTIPLFLIARTWEKAKRRKRRRLHARRPGFTDRSIHRRTKYRATGLTVKSLSYLAHLARGN